MEQFSFCPTLVDVLTTGGKGRTGKTFGPGSVSTVNNLVVLRSLLQARQPRRTLEVGMALGGSALLFLATHRGLGRPAEGQHCAIDPFQDSYWDSIGLDNVEKAGLTGYLTVRPEPSAMALSDLLRQNHRVDLAYVDGSHLFEDVFVDFYFLNKLTDVGGLLLFDDCTDPHVRKVIRFIKSNMTEAFREYDLSPHRADRGGLKYRVGRWLDRTQLRAFEKVGPSERKWDSPFTNF